MITELFCFSSQEYTVVKKLRKIIYKILCCEQVPSGLEVCPCYFENVIAVSRNERAKPMEKKCYIIIIFAFCTCSFISIQTKIQFL